VIQAQLDHDLLFRALAPELRMYLARYVGSDAVAEDLVQDLFLAMWARRATMRIEGSMRAYLFTAARNRALNHLKHERIVDRFRLALIEQLEESDPSTPGEADILATLEIQRAIETLPPRFRQMFTMSRIQDMSYRQIAMSLRLSIKTVEAQMGRARKALRAHQPAFVA
jgi:RNA polymerase sigma-70 factor, ECF subfamily